MLVRHGDRRLSARQRRLISASPPSFTGQGMMLQGNHGVEAHSQLVSDLFFGERPSRFAFFQIDDGLPSQVSSRVYSRLTCELAQTGGIGTKMVMSCIKELGRGSRTQLRFDKNWNRTTQYRTGTHKYDSVTPFDNPTYVESQTVPVKHSGE